MDRKILDRRRLEEAHLKLCILDVFRRYSSYFKTWSLNTDTQISLESITPTFYDAFSAKYGGKQVHLYVNFCINIHKLVIKHYMCQFFF